MIVTEEAYLEHYGVKGMKWGVRKDRAGGAPDRLDISDSDSAVTKRVKTDYNNYSDKEFRRKYAASKKTYAKRVKKHGDPYMNSPMAKIGKRINKKNANHMPSRNRPDMSPSREAKAKQAQTKLKIQSGAVLAVSIASKAYLYYNTQEGRQKTINTAANAGKLYRKAKNVIDPNVETLLKRGGNLRVRDITGPVIDVGLADWRKLGPGS